MVVGGGAGGESYFCSGFLLFGSFECVCVVFGFFAEKEREIRERERGRESERERERERVRESGRETGRESKK